MTKKRGQMRVSHTMLSREDFAKAQFIGVFRHPDRPQQRVPVRLLNAKAYDLLGQEILNFKELVKVHP